MKKSSDKRLREAELRGLHRLTAGQVHHRSPALAPGGRLLCLEVGEGDGSAWLLCDDKGRVARVLEGPAEGAASFSPDGAVAYGRRVGAALEIWQLGAGEHAPRQLLGRDGRLYRDPAFSPDGRRLCYSADERSDEGGALRLWQLDLPSGARSPLPGLPVGPELHVGRPAWSPAADRLYCEVSSPAGTAVYCLELDEQGAPREALLVTAAGERCRRPAPLGGDLVVVEREREDGTTELLLLQHGTDRGEDERAAGLVEQGRSLTDPERCARDPVVLREGGELLIAFAMLNRAQDDEPRRYDVYLARLAGLPRRLSRRAAPAKQGAAER